MRRGATIPARTCCMRRCARCWAQHVKQAGSLVSPSRLRFDFSHFAAVADEELQDIEDMVNRQVLGNTKVETLVDVPIDVAVNEYKAMALFGEKYGERVRVVKIGDFSTELCGGTHTGATGEIGLLKLTGESSVSSGVRRVEAVSGMGALGEFRRGYEAAQFATHVTGAGDTPPAEALRQRFSAQEEEIKRLRRELDQARMKSAASSVASATDQAIEIKGVKVLSQRVAALDRGQMRTLVDNLRNKLGSGVVVLGSAAEDGKVALIVGVTKDLTSRLRRKDRRARLRSASAAQAADVPTWQKPVAKMRHNSTRRWPVRPMWFANCLGRMALTPSRDRRVPPRSPKRTPDFLSRLVALANFMRLSLMKAAHAGLGGAPCRKSGYVGRKRRAKPYDCFCSGGEH